MEKLLLLLVTVLFLPACSDDSNFLTPVEKVTYRGIAYNILSDNEKESITIDWREAKVYEGMFTDSKCDYTFLESLEDWMCFFPYDDEMEFKSNQDLIAVQFNPEDDALLGPIIVIVDPNEEIVVGIVGRL